MRSRSRGRSDLPDERNGRPTGRRMTKKQELRCTGCTCDNCKKLREAAKGLNVNWCEEYKENGEAQVKVSERSNQVMNIRLGGSGKCSWK